MPDAVHSERRDGLGTLGHGLFIAIFAFYWITISPFVDLTGAASVDPVAGNSNRLNQLVTFGLFGSLVLFYFVQRRGVPVLQPKLLIGIILFWILLTSATALYPDLAFKRAILIGIVVTNAAIVLVLPRTEADFARLAGYVIMLALLMSYYGIAFRPSLAIHQASEIREPMNAGLWRGIFPHKNSAAAAMVISVFFGLFIARVWSRAFGWTIIILAVYFLAHTGGKTSTLVLPAILVLGALVERFAFLRLPVILGGLASFNLVAVGAAVSEPLREFVMGLGVDPTFTNRSDIWRYAFSAIAERPIFGHGLQSFWQTESQVYGGGTLETWAAAAYNGHNGYIDTLLELGIPGLLLTIVWLVLLPIRDLGRAQARQNNPAMTRLFLRIWLYALLISCLESLLYQGGDPLWFCLLFSVFGLRLQGSARLVPAEPRAAAIAMVPRHA